MLPRIWSRVVGWAKAHHFYGLEIEERGESLWAFMRTWEKGTFRRVSVDVVDRFAVDAPHEVAVLGSVVAAVGSSASLVAISGGSHVLADTYEEYLGSGYSNKLVEYPISDLRPSPEAMLTEGDLFRLWVFGSFLDDGIYCQESEGCRTSRLDDVPIQSSPCHHHWRAVDAVSC